MPELNTLGPVIKTTYESEANTNAFTDAEKAKLGGIAAGATVNATDAQLRDRATHTGQDPWSAIANADATVRSIVEQFLKAGANVTLTPSGDGLSLTIAATGGGSAGVEVRDEGVSAGTATALNFVGAGVSSSVTGGVGTVTIPGGVIIREDGVQEGTGVGTLDFTGAGVDVGVSGGVATVTIASGGSGAGYTGVVAASGALTLTAGDAGAVVRVTGGTAKTITLPDAFGRFGDEVTIVNIGAGLCTVSAGTNGINLAGTNTLELKQFGAAKLIYANATDPRWLAIEVDSGTVDETMRSLDVLTTINVTTGGATPIDLLLGRRFRIVLGASIDSAADWTFSNVPPGTATETTISLTLQQDATGGKTVAWPSSFRWPDGTAPTMPSGAGARLRVVATTQDGGATWDAHLVGKSYA
mgnify:CR=1 FL=1